MPIALPHLSMRVSSEGDAQNQKEFNVRKSLVSVVPTQRPLDKPLKAARPRLAPGPLREALAAELDARRRLVRAQHRSCLMTSKSGTAPGFA